MGRNLASNGLWVAGLGVFGFRAAGFTACSVGFGAWK